MTRMCLPKDKSSLLERLITVPFFPLLRLYLLARVLVFILVGVNLPSAETAAKDRAMTSLSFN